MLSSFILNSLENAQLKNDLWKIYVNEVICNHGYRNNFFYSSSYHIFSAPDPPYSWKLDWRNSLPHFLAFQLNHHYREFHHTDSPNPTEIFFVNLCPSSILLMQLDELWPIWCYSLLNKIGFPTIGSPRN